MNYKIIFIFSFIVVQIAFLTLTISSHKSSMEFSDKMINQWKFEQELYEKYGGRFGGAGLVVSTSTVK